MNDIATRPLATEANGSSERPSLEPVTRALATEAKRTRALAEDWLADSAEQCKRAAHQLSDQAHLLADRSREQVRARPGTALMVAAAAGAVLAGLIGLAASRRH